MKKIDMSIIIPMYNVEDYVEQCINSIIAIEQISLEIIVIDDGSTDTSYNKVEAYLKKHENILLIQQTNMGLSKTRNVGLNIAKGTYILFLDSDDWINPNELVQLYQKAIDSDVDIILGRTLFEEKDKISSNPYEFIPNELENNVITGKTCFVKTMEYDVNVPMYVPMVWSYLYKRVFLIENHFSFVDVVFEDEIWTLETTLIAEKVLLTNIDFHHYRQRSNSIFNDISHRNRVNNLFAVANYIYGISLKYNSKEYINIKSWIFIKILQVYHVAYFFATKIKDSNFVLPESLIDRVINEQVTISKDVRPFFDNFLHKIKNYAEMHHSYINSDLFKSALSINESQTIILIFNNEWGGSSPFNISEIPENIIVTTDRKLLAKADAVIFHMPNLINELEGDIDKPKHQLWISWFLESDVNYPFVNNKEFMSVFDYEMSYRQNSDMVVPYYNYDYLELLKNSKKKKSAKNDICMLISDSFNKSKRQEYLEELMLYIDVDSYGTLLNNRALALCNGRSSKLELYSNYKFVIAFENSIADDYVTEQFYDPLIASSVPIYFGAPNIIHFAPSENCFVNVRDFKDPKELALFLKKNIEDVLLYDNFFSWKKNEIASGFTEKVIKTKPDKYIAAFKIIAEKVHEHQNITKD